MLRKQTLRVKIAFLVIGILLFVVVLGLIFCNVFMIDFYMSSRKKALEDVYKTINGIYLEGLEPNDDSESESLGTPFGMERSGSDREGKSDRSDRSESDDNSSTEVEDTVVSEKLQLEIDKLSMNRSLSILIYRNVYVVHELYGILVPSRRNELLYSSLGVGQDSRLSNNMIYADYAKDTEGQEELSPGNFRIRQIGIERLDSSYLYLEGRLPNNDYILLRASVASIKESVSLCNIFLLYIFGFAVIFGFILTYFVTGRFVKPITELTKMAKRMSELDFTAKYPVQTADEIGDLGKSINTLSESLERSIGDLKDANARLQTDLKKREEIDELRKEFLSNVSHELKTPIALIQGYAEGLIDNVADDEESRQFYCEVIMDESNKMNNMVRQIMSLNQLEFGYSQVNIEYFDVADLIRSVIARQEILIREKEADILFAQEEPSYVWSDCFMVEEVFTNYFTNALNHLDGEKQIRITLEDKTDTLRVNVFNTGNHIPEEDLPRIWDKFFKVDKARTREYGGSGVGLSIVKATMNLLGQDFGVENVPDGVLFWFELDRSSGTSSNEQQMDSQCTADDQQRPAE